METLDEKSTAEEDFEMIMGNEEASNKAQDKAASKTIDVELVSKEAAQASDKDTQDEQAQNEASKTIDVELESEEAAQASDKDAKGGQAQNDETSKTIDVELVSKEAAQALEKDVQSEQASEKPTEAEQVTEIAVQDIQEADKNNQAAENRIHVKRIPEGSIEEEESCRKRARIEETTEELVIINSETSDNDLSYAPTPPFCRQFSNNYAKHVSNTETANNYSTFATNFRTRNQQGQCSTPAKNRGLRKKRNRKMKTKSPKDELIEKLIAKVDKLQAENTTLHRETQRLCVYILTKCGINPPSGYVNDKSEIHLGQGVWLPQKDYDNATFAARTRGQFVINIAVAVFGLPELRRSSMPGCTKMGQNHNSKPVLDVTKLLAIRDIYEHYLEKAGLSNVEIEQESPRYTDYISGAIGNLNQNKPSTNKKHPRNPQSQNKRRHRFRKRRRRNGTDQGQEHQESDFSSDEWTRQMNMI